MKAPIRILLALLFLFSLLDSNSVQAQENPPVPIKVEVNTSQFMNFGAFTTGDSGGTISVDPSGNISTTGSVVKLHMGETPSSALFDVFGIPGSLITILPTTRIELEGSNGGYIYLEIDSFSTGRTFITNADQNAPNPVYVGGTLIIESQDANPAGRYEGQFNLTFVHQ